MKFKRRIYENVFCENAFSVQFNQYGMFSNPGNNWLADRIDDIKESLSGAGKKISSFLQKIQDASKTFSGMSFQQAYNKFREVLSRPSGNRQEIIDEMAYLIASNRNLDADTTRQFALDIAQDTSIPIQDRKMFLSQLNTALRDPDIGRELSAQYISDINRALGSNTLERLSSRNPPAADNKRATDETKQPPDIGRMSSNDRQAAGRPQSAKDVADRIKGWSTRGLGMGYSDFDEVIKESLPSNENEKIKYIIDLTKELSSYEGWGNANSSIKGTAFRVLNVLRNENGMRSIPTQEQTPPNIIVDGLELPNYNPLLD